MIADARRKAAYQVNATMIDLYWGIGEFVSNKAVQDGWGRSTVKALSEYILTQEPGIRGYSPQNIWRMKQFFETYCDKPELGTLLRENTWSNNLHIMSKTKSDAEGLFYLKLASREKYKAKELERQIDSGYYERLMLSDGKAPSAISQAAPANIIRDIYWWMRIKTLNDVESFSKNQFIMLVQITIKPITVNAKPFGAWTTFCRH